MTLLILFNDREGVRTFVGVPLVTAEAIGDGFYPFDDEDGKGRYILVYHTEGIERLYVETIDQVRMVEELQ